MLGKNIVISIVMCVMMIATTMIYATDFVPVEPTHGVDERNENLEQYIADMWATISVIIQIISVGCVVFAGLRYMFSAADKRADIKTSMIYLAIGSVLVFSAVMIINFVITVYNQVNPS